MGTDREPSIYVMDSHLKILLSQIKDLGWKLNMENIIKKVPIHKMIFIISSFFKI